MDRLTEIPAERMYAESKKVVDAVRSAKIICHMKAFEPGYYPAVSDKEDALAIIDALQEQAEREKGCELCTENENFIQNKFGYCFYSLGSCPFIYNLYVHPQYRRSGNSKRLLELAIGEIRKSGYNGEIRIEAKPREGSIGLKELVRYYQSMGLAVMVERSNMVFPPNLSDPAFLKRMAEDKYRPLNMPNRPII